MSKLIEVTVPDIGDFKNVPVIEVLVKPGDTVKPEDPLVTLESDKATMDGPAPAPGVVKELKLKVGDKVSQGSAILTLDSDAVAGTGSGASQASAPATASQPTARAPESRPAPPASSVSAAAGVARQPATPYTGPRGDIHGE